MKSGFTAFIYAANFFTLEEDEVPSNTLPQGEAQLKDTAATLFCLVLSIAAYSVFCAQPVKDSIIIAAEINIAVNFFI